uniref:hypothetical protein n=1 Tax=Streptomyces polyasparticus TaxID=2767826 RepID=UPI001BE469FB
RTLRLRPQIRQHGRTHVELHRASPGLDGMNRMTDCMRSHLYQLMAEACNQRSPAAAGMTQL